MIGAGVVGSTPPADGAGLVGSTHPANGAGLVGSTHPANGACLVGSTHPADGACLVGSTHPADGAPSSEPSITARSRTIASMSAGPARRTSITRAAYEIRIRGPPRGSVIVVDTPRVYVESGAGMALDDTTVAWIFDDARWGVCGQGPDEAAALAALGAQVPGELRVAERIAADEKAFRRDYEPATEAERAATLDILAAARADTIALVSTVSDAVLDHEDPWRTLRQTAWHVADTESRYYLPSLGLPPRPRADELIVELRASAAYVARMVAAVDPARAHADANGEWTTTKLLRRLAWHERSELVTMRALAATAKAAGR
jgi:hypothetical protein